MTQDIGTLVERLRKVITHLDKIAYRDGAELRLQSGHWPYDNLVAICNDLEALTTAVEIGRAMGRGEAAKIVAGQPYRGPFRTWPEIGPGNRSNDSEITKFADAIAFAIRSATPALDVEALTETVARAKDAVRDEFGSRICGWLDVDDKPTKFGAGDAAKRVCRKETGWSECMCESVARAVLRSLGIGVKE